MVLDELSALPPTDDSSTKGRAFAASGYAVAVVRARRNEVGLFAEGGQAFVSALPGPARAEGLASLIVRAARRAPGPDPCGDDAESSRCRQACAGRAPAP